MQSSSRLHSPRRIQAGASLLEVLIAVLILAIGLLGIAALQAITLSNTQSASDRTAGVIQSYAMLDMMRANRQAAVAGAYNTGGYICEVPAAGDRADSDTALWIAQMQQAMGGTACGSINCVGADCTVNVRWNEDRATGNRDTTSTEEKLELTTEATL